MPGIVTLWEKTLDFWGEKLDLCEKKLDFSRGLILNPFELGEPAIFPRVPHNSSITISITTMSLLSFAYR
jgi:hypothetical protein